MRRSVDNRLHHLRRWLLADRVVAHAARLPFDESDDVRGLFFSSDEGEQLVHLQRGGLPATACSAGSRAWAALSRLATYWWPTPNSLPMRRKLLPSR
jgi:hypothetical protein